MNHALIRGWYAALNSDEHKQGNGAMERITHDGKTLQCCLGVLCRVAITMGLDLPVTIPSTSEGYRQGKVYFGKGDAYGTLPVEVVDMLYTNSMKPSSHNPPLITDTGFYHSATDLNDGGEYTFSKIATCIKRTWPEAFVD